MSLSTGTYGNSIGKVHHASMLQIASCSLGVDVFPFVLLLFLEDFQISPGAQSGKQVFSINHFLFWSWL